MVTINDKGILDEKPLNIAGYFRYAGVRYWTASLLPALTGMTLPFWLHPSGYEFKWAEAALFLFATVVCHAGFSWLHACFRIKHASKQKRKLLGAGTAGIVISIITGLYLNTLLKLNDNVYESIFIVYGISVIFAGLLYVAPLSHFSGHIYHEIILFLGLGMMPVLGGCLVQTGDLTRTVYLASLPVVVSTALWIWTSGLINRTEEKSEGYNRMSVIPPPGFSSRSVTIILTIAVYAALILAVLGRSSLNPLSLAALFSVVFARKIILCPAKITKMPGDSGISAGMHVSYISPSVLLSLYHPFPLFFWVNCLI